MKVKVLIVIDSFKGSLNSKEVSNAVTKGIKHVYPKANIISFPVADGGEGTVESIVYAKGGDIISKTVTGPLGEKVNSNYGILKNNKTAVIEIAEACGLTLVPKKKLNPLITTTYGVGELINDALEKGCNEFIIGLGGSSTNDAGIGMLQALGYSFIDKNKNEVGFGGGSLEKIDSIDSKNVNPKLKDCIFKVACDVNNTLVGFNGAAHTFGAQKGATSEIIGHLESGMNNFINVVYKDFKIDIKNTEGAGAAGGLGAAFNAFANGELLSGIELMLDILDLEKYLKTYDYIITGEGKLDNQTSLGKVPVGIARLASKDKIPVIALAGNVERDTNFLNEKGITSYFSIVNKPMSLEEAMKFDVTYENLIFTTTQLFNLIKKSY